MERPAVQARHLAQRAGRMRVLSKTACASCHMLRGTPARGSLGHLTDPHIGNARAPRGADHPRTRRPRPWIARFPSSEAGQQDARAEHDATAHANCPRLSERLR